MKAASIAQRNVIVLLFENRQLGSLILRVYFKQDGMSCSHTETLTAVILKSCSAVAIPTVIPLCSADFAMFLKPMIGVNETSEGASLQSPTTQASLLRCPDKDT